MNRRQFIAGLIGTGAIASGIGCLLCRKTEFTDIHPALLYTVVFSGDTHSRSENDYARGYSFAYDWLLEMKWREKNKNLDQFIDITDSLSMLTQLHGMVDSVRKELARAVRYMPNRTDMRKWCNSYRDELCFNCGDVLCSRRLESRLSCILDKVGKAAGVILNETELK